MGNVARYLAPINTQTTALHAGLVVLGVIAAMLVTWSPAPLIGLLVLAIVLGVEIPVAAWNFLGVRCKPITA